MFIAIVIIQQLRRIRMFIVIVFISVEVLFLCYFLWCNITLQRYGEIRNPTIAFLWHFYIPNTGYSDVELRGVYQSGTQSVLDGLMGGVHL